MMEKGKRRRRDGVVGKRKQSGEQWKEKTEKRGQRKGTEEKEGARDRNIGRERVKGIGRG